MFTQYNTQEQLKIECYFMVLYERKKSHELKFMGLWKVDNG